MRGKILRYVSDSIGDNFINGQILLRFGDAVILPVALPQIHKQTERHQPHFIEDVFIRCGRCGKITGIHKEDFDFESYVYDRGDNRMGAEIEFRHEEYIECDQCGNEISFKISGYE